MTREEIKLECLRIAGGDLAKAKELYAFVVDETIEGQIVYSTVQAPTRWVYSAGSWGVSK